MTVRTPAQLFSPGEILVDELNAQGWSQSRFAQMIGRSPGFVSAIVCARRAISPQTARLFAQALGTSAELWLNLEARYQSRKAADPVNTASRSTR